MEDLPRNNRGSRRCLKILKVAATATVNNASEQGAKSLEEEDLFSDEEDIVDYPDPFPSNEELITDKDETPSISSYDSDLSSTSSMSSSSTTRLKSKKVTIEEEDDPEAPPFTTKSSKPPMNSEQEDYIPKDSEVIMAAKKEAKPEGLGSLGAQALHIKVHVQSIGRGEVKARLDSGADITLISEEFWKQLGTLAKPKVGMRMKLYHLTGHTKVLGYVKTRLYTLTTDNSWVCFELEAYVIQGMRVPLLLGEDFQTAYELQVKRYTTGHSEVTVGSGTKIIPASSAHDIDLGFEIRQAYLAKSFVRTRTARRK